MAAFRVRDPDGTWKFLEAKPASFCPTEWATAASVETAPVRRTSPEVIERHSELYHNGSLHDRFKVRLTALVRCRVHLELVEHAGRLNVNDAPVRSRA
jgi:hypothetical protein